MKAETEFWPLRAPFAIAGRVFTTADLLVVTLSDGSHTGRGEAAGVFFDDETPASMTAQLAALGPSLPADRAALLERLPSGGARNALDLALWDLEAQRSGQLAWMAMGGTAPAPVRTAFTIGLSTPDEMAAAAAQLPRDATIKLKLGSPQDDEIVRAVRRIRPVATLLVDANGGWDLDGLHARLPALQETDVALVEQPLPAGQDRLLAGLASPIPFAADESVRTADDLPRLAGLYQFVNIKLDKAGGLTAALALADRAEVAGLGLMVGCMECTSLGLAPAVLLAQRAAFADLDGAWLLAHDRPGGFSYCDGWIVPPAIALWGETRAA